jgi:flagellar protein FlgJ
VEPTSLDAVTSPGLGPSQRATSSRSRSDAELRKAAQEFEAYFVQQLLSQMRKAIPSGGLLHSRGEDMFRDLMDEQLGKDIAQGHGFGLSDSLYRQLSLEQGHTGQ